MDFGLHLPLVDFGGNPYTLDHLIAYAKTGQQIAHDEVDIHEKAQIMRTAS